MGAHADRASAVINTLEENGVEVSQVAVVGQSNEVDKLRTFFRGRLGISKVTSRIAPAGKNAGDIVLSCLAGRFLEVAITSDEIKAVALASEDKNLAKCLLPWIREGFSTYSVLINKDTEGYYSYNKLKKVTSFRLKNSSKKSKQKYKSKEPVFNERYNAYEYEDSYSGSLDVIEVVKVPTARSPVPSYIPLPPRLEELTAGSTGSNDVPLKYWEEPHELYSPHVYLGFRHEGWYIRSAKGHRRGKKSVIVRGKNVNSQDGNIDIYDGDEIQFGGFELVLRTNDIIDHEINLDSDSNYEVVTYIEKFLHQLIVDRLSSEREDWWEDMVPEKTKNRCESRSPKDTREHPIRYSTISDLDKCISKNWRLFKKGKFASSWKSKTKFRDSVSDLIQVRHKVMHSTRPDPTPKEEAFLQKMAAICADTEQHTPQ